MFASVSIDLDGLDCYHTIHGLEPPGPGNPVYELALPRFVELFDELGIKATFFVITRYTDEPGAVDSLRAALDAGHELASHTHTHPYNLSHHDPEAMAAELDRASDALEHHFGVRPIGFRAPGYHAGNDLLDRLEERGYRYDSSVFPCPPYYLAKGLIMAGMRVTGRRSGSAMTDSRANFAPTTPYRPHPKRYYRPGRKDQARRIWEIPMCVLPGIRFPIIGTSMAMMGPKWFRRLLPLIRRRHQFLNLELHGIDLIDPGDVGVEQALIDKQPDLRRSLDHKLNVYRQAILALQAHYEFGTLARMTERLGA
jgi:peptidoglycan/xylan/chitin deacetylase (PgdA/CDA1 family)